MNLELRLSVEDSPEQRRRRDRHDPLRRVALDRGMAGPIDAAGVGLLQASAAAGAGRRSVRRAGAVSSAAECLSG